MAPACLVNAFPQEGVIMSGPPAAPGAYAVGARHLLPSPSPQALTLGPARGGGRGTVGTWRPCPPPSGGQTPPAVAMLPGLGPGPLPTAPSPGQDKTCVGQSDTHMQPSHLVGAGPTLHPQPPPGTLQPRDAIPQGGSRLHGFQPRGARAPPRPQPSQVSSPSGSSTGGPAAPRPALRARGMAARPPGDVSSGALCRHSG